jgi:hypothetical protein
MGRQRSYSDDQLRAIVPQVTSWSSLCRALGITLGGGNSVALRKTLEQLGISTEHFLYVTGKGQGRRLKTKDLFTSDPHPTVIATSGNRGGRLRDRLIKEGLFQNCCARCGQGPEWQGEPLNMFLHQKDFNSSNLALDNLELLCPNCYAQKVMPTRARELQKLRVEAYRRNQTERSYARLAAEMKRGF